MKSKNTIRLITDINFSAWTETEFGEGEGGSISCSTFSHRHYQPGPRK